MIGTWGVLPPWVAFLASFELVLLEKKRERGKKPTQYGLMRVRVFTPVVWLNSHPTIPYFLPVFLCVVLFFTFTLA